MDDPRSCPRCGCESLYRYKSRAVFRCKECRHHFSATAGTLLSSRKMPLDVYERAFRVVVETGQGVSTIRLARELGCQQKTGWLLARRIREAQMIEVSATPPGLRCSFCGATNTCSKPIPPGEELKSFRCGHCKGIVSVSCGHPKLPDLGRDNAVCLKQCPDCHAACYWDDGWRVSGIKLHEPNMSDEEILGAFVSQAMTRPKGDLSYEAMKKSGPEKRARRTMVCPHCRAATAIPPNGRTPAKVRCGSCGRTFPRAGGIRYLKLSLPVETYNKAWEMFEQGRSDKEVSDEVGVSRQAIFRWRHWWRDGFQIPEAA